MSDIEHPSKDQEDENINLVPTTVNFALTAVIGIVGMFLILIYNYNGGF